MSNLSVLVVGASIAGPMTAYWLARAGCKVTIIERFPSLRPGGQNIDIRSVGVTVMRKIPGMEEAVRANRAPIDAFTFLDNKGKVFARMEASGDPDAQTVVSEYEIFRGDLSRVMCDLLKPYEAEEKVRFIFNEQVASIAQHGDGEKCGPATVEFANGTPTAEFDLVVAADGSTGRTRAMGLNCGVRDHIKPLNLWAAYFTTPESMLKDDWQYGANNAVPGRMYGINGTKAILMRTLPSNDQDATLPYRQAQKAGDEALKQFIADTYKDAGYRANEIIEGMWQSKDFYSSEIVQVKVPSLSNNGCFTMVGDAGYASGFTGTGTSLAMCGAYVLAGELLSHPGDVRAGLKAYEQRMQPIIKDMQTVPPGVKSFLAPQTHWGLALRNVLVRVICFGMKFGKYLSWTTSWYSSAFQADKFGLPDYEWVSPAA